MNIPSLYGDGLSFVANGSQENAVEKWLKTIGLAFDPFAALEASTDARLSSYFIGHEAFSIAWGDWNSIIFAPAGGGKTALRARVVQSCWVGQETNRPFPIAYIPPYTKWGHTKPSREEHIQSIAESGAEYLLLALAHRPHWHQRLDENEKSAVRRALHWNLPGPVSYYLKPCSESRSLEPLREKFSPVALPPDPPKIEALAEFFHYFEQKTSIDPKPDVLERWDVLLDVLLNILRFPSIYILLDGLDATQDMVESPSLAGEFFDSLVPFFPEWTARRIYLKTFIPIETKEPVQNHSPEFVRQSQVTTLEWTPALLAELVRRRIYVASEGEYGSLGPLSSPEIRDPEIELAKAVFPLPREMLVLTRKVFTQVTERVDQNPKITNQDIELAITWYKMNSPYNMDGTSYFG